MGRLDLLALSTMQWFAYCSATSLDLHTRWVVQWGIRSATCCATAQLPVQGAQLDGALVLELRTLPDISAAFL